VPIDAAARPATRPPTRLRWVAVSAPGWPPRPLFRPAPKSLWSSRPTAPPPPIGLNMSKPPSPPSSPSSSSRSTCSRCRRGTCSSPASAAGGTGRTCRARMTPNTAGGSAMGSRLRASASDSSGELVLAATTSSISPRATTGNTASCTANARCPSTARYRRATPPRRPSSLVTPAPRLPAPSSAACTVTARTCSRRPAPPSTNTTSPSVHANSPAPIATTSTPRPAIAEANNPNPSTSALGPAGVEGLGSGAGVCMAVAPLRLIDPMFGSTLASGRCWTSATR
jgi:hypothetical protein